MFKSPNLLALKLKIKFAHFDCKTCTFPFKTAPTQSLAAKDILRKILSMR